MYISRIDGYLNPDLIVQRDTLICANSFVYLGRCKYNSDQMDKINKIKDRQKVYFKGYDE